MLPGVEEGRRRRALVSSASCTVASGMCTATGAAGLAQKPCTQVETRTGKVGQGAIEVCHCLPSSVSCAHHVFAACTCTMEVARAEMASKWSEYQAASSSHRLSAQRTYARQAGRQQGLAR